MSWSDFSANQSPGANTWFRIRFPFSRLWWMATWERNVPHFPQNIKYSKLQNKQTNKNHKTKTNNNNNKKKKQTKTTTTFHKEILERIQRKCILTSKWVFGQLEPSLKAKERAILINGWIYYILKQFCLFFFFQVRIKRWKNLAIKK